MSIKIKQALTKLVMGQPFYASIALSTPIEPEHGVGTMCTGGSKIMYDPVFVDALTVDETLFVLLHEVEHIIRLHSFRRGHRDARIWNMAADHVINNDLLALPRLTPPKDEKGNFSGLADPRYKGLSVEQVYNLLIQDGQGGNQEGEGKGEGEGSPRHRRLEPDDVMNPSGSEAEVAEKEREVRGRISVAAESVRRTQGEGHIPAHLRDSLVKLTEPQVDWRYELRDFVSATTKNDYSWSRLNRRVRHRGLRLPSTYSDQVGGVGVILDTSGSVHHAIAPFLSEVISIANDVKPERIIVIFIDTQVQARIETTPDDFEADMGRYMTHPPYGGGTDLRQAFHDLEDEELDAVVCLTDMETDWPGDFTYADSTLFVDTYGYHPPPFGRKVAYEPT